MRSLLGGLVLVGVLGVTSARADIRIDRPPTPPRTPATPEAPAPATPEAPVPPPTPEPPPAPEPRSQGGCAGREMGGEWLFGLAVLAVGLGGMRWQRRRHAAAA